MTASNTQHVIALIGVGSIGVSFAALYLKHSGATIKIYDPRPDLADHVHSILPSYLDTSEQELSVDTLTSSSRLQICSSLQDACSDATIIQESGPENVAFKSNLWADILSIGLDLTSVHLWSSTSGIAASKQLEALSSRSDLSAGRIDIARSRLLVIHPFNPPHIMPLLEVVPSAATNEREIEFAKDFFHSLKSGHTPVVIKKEVPGFVGNRLAFVLFREACHLVSEGVVSVEDCDKIVEASVGPRWAVTGPFRSYHYGGGTKGLDAFFKNLSGTMQDIWDDAGEPSFNGTTYDAKVADQQAHQDSSWADDIVRQTHKAYGTPSNVDFQARDQGLRSVLQSRDKSG